MIINLESILILISIILIFFEIILNFLIRYLKKDFKWLINYEDEKPKFEKKNLSNFYQNSFDNLLGWDRKKNSSGFELSSKKTFFIFPKLVTEENQNSKKLNLMFLVTHLLFVDMLMTTKLGKVILKIKLSQM